MRSKPQRDAVVSGAEIAAVNIGEREQLKRRVMGIVCLVVGAGLAFMLIAYDAPRLFRVVVFFPLWMAGLGLFQAQAKTCIALAARAACNMDRGEEKIEDENLVGRIRLQARRIHRRALVLALVLTVIAVIFP